MDKLEQYAGCDGLLDMDIPYHRRCYVLGLNPIKVNWTHVLKRVKI